MVEKKDEIGNERMIVQNYQLKALIVSIQTIVCAALQHDYFHPEVEASESGGFFDGSAPQRFKCLFFQPFPKRYFFVFLIANDYCL
jgi:hypothetical protein